MYIGDENVGDKNSLFLVTKMYVGDENVGDENVGAQPCKLSWAPRSLAPRYDARLQRMLPHSKGFFPGLRGEGGAMHRDMQPPWPGKTQVRGNPGAWEDFSSPTFSSPTFW